MTAALVKVLTTEEWRTWVRQHEAGATFKAACRATVAEQGWVPVMIQVKGFSWVCPGCGSIAAGNLGEQPVSGWDSPRWVLSGTVDAPSLTPSLGCPKWRDGTCSGGHYWLHDGQLVDA